MFANCSHLRNRRSTWAPLGCASCGRMKSTPITPTIRSSCSGGAATKPLTIWNTRLAASFGRCPSAFLCVVTLDARTQQAAFEEAAALWQRHPPLDGRVGYAIFDRQFTDCV